MERERQKFYKHKIKRISVSKEDNTSSVTDKSDTTKSTVTILGSASYHEQVNDLSIFNSNSIGQQPESLIDDPIDLNDESNFYAHSVDIETKTTQYIPDDLKDEDLIINEVTIEVERAVIFLYSH
ncbi:jg25689 [Pararge aegeria aegeria]|uniref:Jg25689 protein n=1 Tax=Pararge aegeria aegeria TaxID=348720 RepID=A0A8S4QU69_9NEOP|nr:jg25689 [Pararge aegeria aegeria]